MTHERIAEEAEKLRQELLVVPSPTMSNYKVVLARYKRILNDLVVLIRELAQGAHSHPEV